MSRRRRASALPILVVVVLLLVGLIGATFAAPVARPSRTPDVPIALPGQQPDATAPPLPTPFGRYPATAAATIVGSCVSGIDPNVVPERIAQAFCVCTLNAYEQLYPTYDRFQQGIASGAITDELRTQISNRCAQAIVGG
ncbi:MAG TPA: hypothetical protein VGS17_10565 [Candidatus Limnocylindria bacterium]|nr:hypothetical protein [Candidatus Limnocylindria bacterium]